MIDFETRQLAGGIAVVSVMGSLDETNRTYFFDCVSDLIEEGFVQIVVDCTGLGHISSAGLAALIRARSHAQSKKGKIFLTDVNATIVDVLALTKINKLLAIYPTTKELLKELSQNKSQIRISPEAEA
jgi:anti-sigma B factor antagonist